jgi:hypothetical protein
MDMRENGMLMNLKKLSEDLAWASVIEGCSSFLAMGLGDLHQDLINLF